MRYHVTPVRMAIINKWTNNKFGKDVEKGEPFGTIGENADWWGHCRNYYGSMDFFVGTQKIKNGSAFQLSNPTSGNISEGIQNINLKEHKYPNVLSALFTFAKIWEQPKCPSDE